MERTDSGRLERANAQDVQGRRNNTAVNQRMVDTVGQAGAQGFQQLGNAVAQAPMIEMQARLGYFKMAEQQLKVDQFKREAELFDSELTLRAKKAQVELIEAQAEERRAGAKRDEAYARYAGQPTQRSWNGSGFYRDHRGGWYQPNWDASTGQTNRNYVDEDDRQFMEEQWRGSQRKAASLTEQRDARTEDIRNRGRLFEQITSARLDVLKAQLSKINRPDGKASYQDVQSAIAAVRAIDGFQLAAIKAKDPEFGNTIQKFIDNTIQRGMQAMPQETNSTSNNGGIPGMTPEQYQEGLRRFGSHAALIKELQKRGYKVK